MTHTILGVDPGMMTGFSLYEDDVWKGSWELPMDDFLAWAEGYAYQQRELMRRITIACEDFKISGQTHKKAQGDRQWSLEQIGVLRFLARKYDHDYELTTPSDAKTFAPDHKLKNAGWWNRGHGHGNDATRQIIAALGRRGVVIGVIV